MALPRKVEQSIRNLAVAGDTGTVMGVIRGLAQAGWTGPIAEVIQLYSQEVQANGAGAREFLAARVPGILANHYYHLSGNALDNDWILYIVSHSGWADPIRAATASGDPEQLEDAVAALRNSVNAWAANGRP